MKRLSLTLLIACCALALTAQDAIRVKYKGAKPTIRDFVTAFVATTENVGEEESCNEVLNAVAYAWDRHEKGLPMEEGVTLTIDEKNGYVLYECRSEYESIEHLLRVEMCYWNEADGKHKLFAYNVASFIDGRCEAGQYDGLDFYRYDNAKKIMTYCEDRRGTEAVYKYDVRHSYTLPRKGKDITVTLWYDSGKKVKTLKWNGKRFTL